jgi:hypothetical protein
VVLTWKEGLSGQFIRLFLEGGVGVWFLLETKALLLIWVFALVCADIVNEDKGSFHF